jgi:hypothetical protein
MVDRIKDKNMVLSTTLVVNFKKQAVFFTTDLDLQITWQRV